MFSKLFGTDNFLELLGTPSFWYTLVILIGVIVIFVSCIKYWNKGGKWIVLGLFCVVYTGLTIFSGININAYYSAKGGIYGAITGIFDTNEVEVVSSMEFKLRNMELTQVGESDIYSANIVMNEVFALDKDVEYMVFVNNMPCTFVQNASDYVLADYRYAFYDDNFEVLLEDTLNFRFAFYTNSTSLRVTTNGGAEALKYWHHYFNKNTFVVKILEVESLDDFDISFETGDVSNYCTVSYSVNGEIKNIQVYKKGEILNLLDYAEGYNAWLLNDEVVENGIVLTENFTLVAEKFYNVNFIVDDGSYKSIKVKVGYLTETIENPSKQFYEFTGWSLDKSTIVDINSVLIQEDTTFYAVFSELDLGAGLYNEETGAIIYSWQELIENGDITIEDNKITKSYAGNLTGRLIIPDGITHILSSGLSGQNITSITIPDSVTYVGDYAFRDCKSLKSVELSKFLDSIRIGVFSGCSSLTHLVIPEEVNSIEVDAFEGCTSLKTIYIPSSVTTINVQYDDGDYDRFPFDECNSDIIIYCETTSKPAGWKDGWNCYDYDTQKLLNVKYGYTLEEYLLEIKG